MLVHVFLVSEGYSQYSGISSIPMIENNSDLNIISRADTFISNVTWEKINQQYDIYCGYWLYRYFGDNIAYVSEEDREAMLRPHLEVFDTFIRNLESHNNDYDSTL